MSAATSILRGAANTDDVGVLFDAAKQRKSFTFMDEVITATFIGSGKVFETTTLSKSCKAVPKCR